MINTKKDRVILISLLKLNRLIKAQYLRPIVAKILRNRAKTMEGYEWVCNLLVDKKMAKNVYPYALTSNWWHSKPIVNVRRLGLNLTLDLRDNLQRCVYFTGKYEPETFELIKNELKKGDTFIDIGAHIGLYSLFAANRLRKIGGGQSLAFEPTPDSAKIIDKNAKLNNLNVELFQTALGKSNMDQKPMYCDLDWGIHDAGIRSLYSEGHIVCYVDIVKFDNWIKQNPLKQIDIIKMDTEGAEFDIIEGMKDSLLRYKPRCIIMELKDSELIPAGKTRNDILTKMKSIGYKPEGDPLEYNQVFRL